MADFRLAMTEADIAELPPEDLKRYLATQEQTVFGHDHRKNRHGQPVEQGIGSPGRETRNHWDAMRKREQMGLEAPGTTDRMMAQAKGGAPGRIIPPEINAPPAAPKHRGNPAGLVKARAAAKAKREAALQGSHA